MTYQRMLYIFAIIKRNHFKMYMFGVVVETHAHDYLSPSPFLSPLSPLPLPSLSLPPSLPPSLSLSLPLSLNPPFFFSLKRDNDLYMSKGKFLLTIEILPYLTIDNV